MKMQSAYAEIDAAKERELQVHDEKHEMEKKMKEKEQQILLMEEDTKKVQEDLEEQRRSLLEQ